MERLSDICDIVFSSFLNFFRECVIALLDVCDTVELRPWFGSEQNGSARTISHRHVSCGAVVRCTQGFVSLSFVGSVHAAAWVIKLTGLSKHMSRVWLLWKEVDLLTIRTC